MMQRMMIVLLAACSLWLTAEDDEKKGWDVNHPEDELTSVSFETETGTWMNLDVSPDGKQLVFDLLGDIYIMPISGGDAKALTQGLAWDMQPRFSPDGQWIAYTSDAAGGDNIWVMKIDGSEARAVTSETFRLLNSPAWSPDGNYIAARKHFTKTRSLGTGEIWLYHVSGGSGLQLTQKPNDQKDVGEPIFSPDGRYVYYSQDTTPGPVFEYSKDPTPGIYTIKRFDRETGETDTLIGGMGGAIRPTPSPDGETMAFVKRDDYDTSLYLHNLTSGKETPLVRGLDRDMQETWAIHGVYPSMAWLPGGQELVYWNQGGFYKVARDGGEPIAIPFKVKAEHTLVKPLRFPIEVAPDAFDVKVMRWVQVAPDGKSVVFQALGHLYVKQLPDGKPKRLTNQNDHFEYFPSYSRDGQKIVYVSWDDQELGAVRVVSAKGGTGKVITPAPGHYESPVFSPDGTRVVYRKTGGGYITSPLWSKETGLYHVSSSGGEATRILEQGVGAHFGADGERLFYLSQDGTSATLHSVDMTGNDKRDHASVDMGTDLRVSPDGKWLAFVQHYAVHVMPFPATGQSLSATAGSQALPVTRLSKYAGDYLHWSGDAGRVYWSLGPELFHRDLKDAFAFLPDAPESLPDPVASGVNLGFKAQADKPSGVVALTGARIVPMVGDTVIERGTIVVKDNRIEAVGSADEVSIPAGAQTIDVSGKTIIPGIIDVHAHGGQGAGDGVIPQQNWMSYAGLTFGVTTIHDPSNDTHTIFAASEMARAGLITAPRTYSTGTILYGATIPGYTAKIDSVEDAEFHLKRLQALGAFTVKSYNQPRRDQRQMVIAAARKMGVMVVPEGGSLLQHNMTMVADGHTGIEHSIPVAAIYDDILQFWPATETHYTPTMGVAYGGISGEHYWYKEHDVWRHPRLSQYVPDYILEPRSRRRFMAPEKEYNHIRVAEVAKQLLDRGLHVQVGAHGQREGLAAHWEIWMLEQGGMTPMEALRCATLYGAIYIGLDRDLGSLETGKLADLAIIDGNPLADLRVSDRVSHVMVNGRLFDAASMNEVAPRQQTREPFFFENGAALPSVDGQTLEHLRQQSAARCGGGRCGVAHSH